LENKSFENCAELEIAVLRRNYSFAYFNWAQSLAVGLDYARQG